MPPEDSRPRSGFRPDIEGLRAVAVLAVVLFHAELPGLTGGFVGVDVFFVISGFLITGLLWREVSTAGAVRMRRFYGARARRLLPASAMVGVVTMIAAALLLPRLQVQSVAIDGITSALYVCNLWFIGEGVNYFGNRFPSPFQHYWSLAVEEQFYLVWPAMIIGTAWVIQRARKLKTRVEATASPRPYVVLFAAVTVVSFLASWGITYLMPPLAYFSLPTRAWQLAAGGLVALTVEHWRKLPVRAAVFTGWAGLGLILLACMWLSPSTAYPGSAALLPTLGAVLVIGAGCAGATQGCGRLLGLPWMGAIGRISYSFYLWHWPVLVLAPALLGHALGFPARVIAVLVSAGLAVLTLRYIENPLRFAPGIRNSARNSLALGAVVTVVAVCVGLLLPKWVPNPVSNGPAATPLTVTAAPAPPGSTLEQYDAAVKAVFAQVQEQVAESAVRRDVPSNLTPALTATEAKDAEVKAILSDGCLRLPFQEGHPECAAGDTASKTTVALIGDSRAAMLNPAFRKVAEQRHWRLEMLAKAACPIVDLPFANHYVNGVAEKIQGCAAWRAQIMDRLRAERPQMIVVESSRLYGAQGTGAWLPGFTTFNPAWIESLAKLVGQLRETGAKVLILGPIPDPMESVPICLSAHLTEATACSAPRELLSPSGIAAESAAVTTAGGQYRDVTDLFCTDTSCPFVVGNTMVYFDTHLTREYAEQLAPAMGVVADRAFAQP